MSNSFCLPSSTSFCPCIRATVSTLSFCNTRSKAGLKLVHRSAWKSLWPSNRTIRTDIARSASDGSLVQTMSYMVRESKRKRHGTSAVLGFAKSNQLLQVKVELHTSVVVWLESVKSKEWRASQLFLDTQVGSGVQWHGSTAPKWHSTTIPARWDVKLYVFLFLEIHQSSSCGMPYS